MSIQLCLFLHLLHISIYMLSTASINTVFTPDDCECISYSYRHTHLPSTYTFLLSDVYGKLTLYVTMQLAVLP